MTDSEIIQQILQAATRGSSGCGYHDEVGNWIPDGTRLGQYVLTIWQLSDAESFTSYIEKRRTLQDLCNMGLIELLYIDSCGAHYQLTDDGWRIARSGEAVVFV